MKRIKKLSTKMLIGLGIIILGIIIWQVIVTVQIVNAGQI